MSSHVVRINGPKVRELRKAKGLSADDIARQLGVSWFTVNRWERSENTPSLGSLHAVARLLDVDDPADLLLTEPTEPEVAA